MGNYREKDEENNNQSREDFLRNGEKKWKKMKTNLASTSLERKVKRETREQEKERG